MSSCLVLDDVDLVTEGNSPPSIESRPAATHPLSSLIILDLSEELPEGDTGEVLLEVNIRDVNTYQELFAQLRVNGRPTGLEGFGFASVPATPNSAIRELDVPVSRASIIGSMLEEGQGKCGRIELWVSSEFDRVTNDPHDEADVGRAVWWVAVRPDDATLINPAECPR